MLSLLLASFLNTANAVPLQLTQQGRLVDSSGTAATGSHDLTFRIYNAASSGTLLWSETISTTFTNGYYAAVLGGDTVNNPLEDSVLESGDIYIELEVNSDGPLTPRQIVSSTPYARIAGKAQAADWTGLTSIPADIDDGDDDTVGSLSCGDGEQPVYSSTNSAWECGNPVVDVDADSRLAALEALVAGLQTDLATTQSDLATANTTISSLESDLATAQADITTNASGVATNASGVSTNSGDISTLNASVSTNTGDLTTNTASIATNTTNIASLQTDVSDAQTDISDLQADLTTAESDIDTLQTDYTTLSGNVLDMISTDTTWTIGSTGDYSNLDDAMVAARDVNIHPDATLTLQFEDGVHSSTTAISLNHPQGNNIYIQGNASNKGAVELYFNGGTSGLTVQNEHKIGGIQYLTIRGNSTTETFGIYIRAGSKATVTDVDIEEFASGIYALENSEAYLTGDNILQNHNDFGLAVRFDSGAFGVNAVTTSNNGIHGVLVGDGSYALLTGLISSSNGAAGIRTWTNSTVDASESDLSNNGAYGIQAYDNGAVNAINSSITSNGPRGVMAYYDAFINVNGSTISNHSSFGVDSFIGAHIMAANVTLSNNGRGAICNRNAQCDLRDAIFQNSTIFDIDVQNDSYVWRSGASFSTSNSVDSTSELD
ncbi:MAG: right-handed parallel beta-helix repeat-containing protein [Myxococcota bacterium]|nr:right-handed parallel beta-helix repeat-containing protein [Myxococcota bacterium]